MPAMDKGDNDHILQARDSQVIVDNGVLLIACAQLPLIVVFDEAEPVFGVGIFITYLLCAIGAIELLGVNAFVG